MLNTARIAKNMVFLYLRMVLVLAANFLAARVLLEVLGIDDYWLFNLIVGFVTLFTLPWHAEASGEGRLNGAMMFTVRSRRKTCFEGSRQAERLLCFELVLVVPVNLLLMLFIGCTSSERTFFRQKLAAKLRRKGNPQ